jgi:hypothetical protein
MAAVWQPDRDPLGGGSEAFVAAVVDEAFRCLHDGDDRVMRFWFVASGDETRRGQINVPGDRSDPTTALSRARRSVIEGEPGLRGFAIAWDGFLVQETVRHRAVLVEAYVLDPSYGALYAQPYARGDGGPARAGDLVRYGRLELPPELADRQRELDEWADGGHQAIRSLVEEAGADVTAFDRDPSTFQGALDDFVTGLDLDLMDEDDWVWLHSLLAAYLAEVLIRLHGGRWMVRHDRNTDGRRRFVVAVGDREVDPLELVHQELRPVPQRIARMIDRATG